MGASKQAEMDEVHRINTQEYDEGGNPKYDNDELVEVIEEIQKKVEKDNG